MGGRDVSETVTEVVPRLGVERILIAALQEISGGYVERRDPPNGERQRAECALAEWRGWMKAREAA